MAMNHARRVRYDEGTNPSHYRGGGGGPSHMRGGGGGPPGRGGGASRGRSVLQRLRAKQQQGGQIDTTDQRRAVQNARAAPGVTNRPFWNKIEINNCKITDRVKLYRELADYVDPELKNQFVPLLYRYMPTGGRGQATFWIESKAVAESLLAASNRVTDDAGRPIRIQSRTELAPIVTLKGHLPGVVTAELDRRYDAATGRLDLSAFGRDRDNNLQSSSPDNVVLPRLDVAIFTSQLIATRCGQLLRSLDLSENRLKHLDAFASFVFATPNVKSLDLSHNFLVDKREIHKLKGWDLVELNLDSNPFCNEFNDVDIYTRDVHAIFPSVTKLDNVDVAPGGPEPEQQFGLDAESVRRRVPAFKPGFYVSAEIQTIIEKFVVEYVRVYDAPVPKTGRQPLMAAYHVTDSQFTMVCERIRPKDWDCKFSAHEQFASYRRESHNVLAVEYWQRYRARLLVNGNLAVVAKLCQLPATEHLMDTMLVDVSFATESLICFTLTGLLREGARARTDSAELRFFARSFLLLRTAVDRVAVLNEMLLLTPFSARMAELHAALLRSAATAAGQQQQVVAAPVVAAPAPAAAVPVVKSEAQQMLEELVRAEALSHQQQQLVLELSNRTGMRPDWAKKCLDDNNWNLPKAQAAFDTIRLTVPADAFL